jgi:hypothetical protein
MKIKALTQAICPGGLRMACSFLDRILAVFDIINSKFAKSNHGDKISPEIVFNNIFDR